MMCMATGILFAVARRWTSTLRANAKRGLTLWRQGQFVSVLVLDGEGLTAWGLALNIHETRAINP